MVEVEAVTEQQRLSAAGGSAGRPASRPASGPEDGPTGIAATAEPVPSIGRAEAEALAGRLMAAAAEVAQHEAEFLRLLADFDRSGAMRWWDGFASVAQWLAWSCSMAPGTAREHVRVARALRRMPATASAYGRGELSFSKVRELTRLIDRHDEATLLTLARAATASQLARTVSAYRALPGTQSARERRARVSWSHRDDGCLQLTATLSPEDGAAVIAALEDAVADRRDDPVVEGDPQAPADLAESDADRARRTRVAALVAIANHWLGTRPEDRSGEDRTTVVIEVDAAVLAGSTTAVPADHESDSVVEPGGVTESTGVAESTGGVESTGVVERTEVTEPTGVVERTEVTEPTEVTDVPAGTCRIRGHAGLEPETVRRRACEASVHAIVRGLEGEPLAVSRTRRFGTRGQRRALLVRDRHCQFPGCPRERHLTVHHVVSWLDGGPTDLDNLMLLCQHHHTAVHEGAITVEPIPFAAAVDPAAVDPAATDPAATDPTAGVSDPVRWRFTRPDGTVILPEVYGYRLDLGVPPLCDGEGRPLTGPDRDRALVERRELLRIDQARRAALGRRRAELAGAYGTPGRTGGPAAQPIFPIGGGEGFDLGNCVEVLFAARRRAEHATPPVDELAA